MNRHKNKTKLILFIIVILQLTGCTTMNSKFDCPMQPGYRCESLDQVNSRIDRGDIDHVKQALVSVVEPMVNPVTPSFLSKKEPIRMRETVLPIWIAPFEDTAGNYHQESEVLAIVKPGYWQGNPPMVVMGDEGEQNDR